MTPRTIHAGGLARPDGLGGPATITLADGRIAGIEPGIDAHADTDADALDARDLVITAGLIDIHTHGAHGEQVIDGRVEAIHRLAAWHAAHGVTAFLATAGGADASIRAGIRATVEAIASPAEGGARCLGVHLEGPFLHPGRPGAFQPATIVAPDVDTFESYAWLAGGVLRRMTLAPDVPGIGPVIERARARGVTLAAGHSQASSAVFAEAVGLGVVSVAHLFNGMPSLHHREAGMVGRALTDPAVTVELIADGLHVDPTILRLAFLAKGWDGIALITDSIAAAGLPDGTYHLEEQEVIVRDGAACLADGTLAGGTAGMDEMVRRFAAAAGCGWEQAVGSASLVPARVLALDDRMGDITVGHLADLTAWDGQRRVVWTMVGGRIVHHRS